MSDLPLHPALVHLPLGLAFVMPCLALALTWVLWARHAPRRTWAIVVALQAILVAGGLVALRTGEAQEDRVGQVVAEAAIAQHEAAAEQFVWAAVATLALAVATLLLKEGAAMRSGLVLTAVASLVVTGLAIRAGHAGGQLVYVHGAASAYSAPAGLPGSVSLAPPTGPETRIEEER